MHLKLTKQLRAKIVGQFAAGEDIATIAFWYGKSVFQIEGVLRDAIKETMGANIVEGSDNRQDEKA